jgi:hypothetical protein
VLLGLGVVEVIVNAPENTILGKTQEMRRVLKRMVDDLNERDATTYALMLQAVIVDLQKLEAFSNDLAFPLYW